MVRIKRAGALYRFMVLSGSMVLFLIISFFVNAHIARNAAAVAASNSFSQSEVDAWWPVNGATVSGTQPFKFFVPGVSANDYTGYWQVDGGQLNLMPTSASDYPHKEANVDLSGWSWSNDGSYEITFVAKDDSGQQLEHSFTIFTEDGHSRSIEEPEEEQATEETEDEVETEEASTESSDSTVKIVTGDDFQEESSSDSSANSTSAEDEVISSPSLVSEEDEESSAASISPQSISGELYAPPYEAALQEAEELSSSNPSDAALLEELAHTPRAVWLGEWSGDVSESVKKHIERAEASGTIPVFVSYNIPNRDCGAYSAGGMDSGNAYRNWINDIARGIGASRALVILEPDGLTSTSCLSDEGKEARFALIRSAVDVLKQNSGTSVYIDAGHARWVGASDMASRLKNAGLSEADGFAINVSNFISTDESIEYGEAISSMTGGAHFVIDTSRNGNGPAANNAWCNPSGRAIGEKPTLHTGNSLVDAFLWIKTPGESDGSCNGAPPAGSWYAEYALELLKNGN